MVFVESAAKSIAPTLKKGSLVILESTSPVGSTEQMAEWLAEMRPDLSFPQQVGEAADVNIAYCPERVLPGQVMVELIKNDRVIGGMSPVCSARASELYKIFLEGECVVTNSRTAEMCKLDGKQLPRRQHRFCQRAVADLRRPGGLTSGS